MSEDLSEGALGVLFELKLTGLDGKLAAAQQDSLQRFAHVCEPDIAPLKISRQEVDAFKEDSKLIIPLVGRRLGKFALSDASQMACGQGRRPRDAAHEKERRRRPQGNEAKRDEGPDLYGRVEGGHKRTRRNLCKGDEVRVLDFPVGHDRIVLRRCFGRVLFHLTSESRLDGFS